MEQVKPKTEKGQEEAPDQAAGKENGEDREGVWARVPHLQDMWAVGGGAGGRESGLGGDRPHSQVTRGGERWGKANTARPTCLALQLGSGQALLHSHPPPAPRILVRFFWDVSFREEAYRPRQAVRGPQARVLTVRASTASSTPQASWP